MWGASGILYKLWKTDNCQRDSFPGSPLRRVGLELKLESDLACPAIRVFCRLRRRRHTKRGLIAYVRRA
jgi:hypothetical protein